MGFWGSAGWVLTAGLMVAWMGAVAVVVVLADAAVHRHHEQRVSPSASDR